MGLSAFREAFLASDTAHEDTFESIEARRIRYALYWAQFDNSVYRRVHTWSTGYKHQYALGKYIRSLYSPANRLGNFYAAHLWGGALDADAGPSGAIPIVSESEGLPPALASLWKMSNFALLKDVIALRGAVEGDIVLRIHDDPEKELVYIERVAPGTVVDITKDALGNVKGYIIEEPRPDPTGKIRTVTYREVVTRSGEDVVYETFLNNRPHGWNGQPATWKLPYGFVPMVHWPHLDVGLDWGWSELHSMRSKVAEVDDLASMIGDQIRKTVNPVWLMRGMSAPSSQLTMTGAQRVETGAADTRPEAGREELKAIWDVPVDAKPEPMIAPLNLGDALQHVDGLLQEIERELPELQADIWSGGGARATMTSSAPSGRALRVARQRVESKVQQRREAYDSGLVRLQMMAVAIGGWRDYEDYAGFNLESYGKGALDHRIGERPVFKPDPLDDVELSTALWETAKVAVEAGASLEGFLASQGWTEEEIAEMNITQIEEKEEDDWGSSGRQGGKQD